MVSQIFMGDTPNLGSVCYPVSVVKCICLAILTVIHIQGRV